MQTSQNSPDQSGEDIGGASKALAVQQSAQQSSFRKYLVSHFFLFVFCLLALHYFLTFYMNLRPIQMNLVYMLAAGLFGYDLSARFRPGVGVALVLGLFGGSIAVIGMSGVVYLAYGQPLFADRRAIQDVVETSTSIMLAYAASHPLADLLSRVLPKPARASGLAATISALISLARREPGKNIVDHISSVDAIAKALLTLILTVGALVVAIKGLFK